MKCAGKMSGSDLSGWGNVWGIVLVGMFRAKMFGEHPVGKISDPCTGLQVCACSGYNLCHPG